MEHIEFSCPPGVALLAEGVDRNQKIAALDDIRDVSPSSRRAWIEIEPKDLQAQRLRVALLAEGVDRNIVVHQGKPSSVYVALLAEGVDRNG